MLISKAEKARAISDVQRTSRRSVSQNFTETCFFCDANVVLRHESLEVFSKRILAMFPQQKKPGLGRASSIMDILAYIKKNAQDKHSGLLCT